jgi:hypothetical protein
MLTDWPAALAGNPCTWEGRYIALMLPIWALANITDDSNSALCPSRFFSCRLQTCTIRTTAAQGLSRAEYRDPGVLWSHPPLDVSAGCLEQLIGEGNIDSCNRYSVHSTVSLLLQNAAQAGVGVLWAH